MIDQWVLIDLNTRWNMFGTSKECDQFWTLGLCNYHQNSSKSRRKSWGHPCIIFSYRRIWNSEMIGRSVYLTFWNLGFINFEISDSLKTQHLEFWQVDFSKMEIRKYEIGHFWNWKFWNWKFENWDFEH